MSYVAKRPWVSPATPGKRLRRMPSKGRAAARRRSIATIGSFRGSLNSPNVHTFVRNVSMQINISQVGFQIGAGSSLYGALYLYPDTITFMQGTNFINASIPGYSDFTALFDEIMVDEWVIDHTACNSAQATGAQPGASILGYAIDYNDNTAPTSLADIQQYPSYRSRLLNADIPAQSIRLKPKMQTYVVDSAGTSVHGVTKRGFYKSTLQIPHFGVKYAFVLQPAATTTATLVLQMKIKFKCRGVK